MRVHRDGTYTPEREIDPVFRAQISLYCHAVCCSPVIRWIDVAVSGVPPGIKFEGRFHNGTLLVVEAGSSAEMSTVRRCNYCASHRHLRNENASYRECNT